MGTWGFGPFDNDGAADLLHFVEEAGASGWALVEKKLRGRDPEMIIAAAELVATALGHASKRDDRTLGFAVGRLRAGPWAKRYAQYMPAGLPARALAAAKRASRLTGTIGWSKPESARRWDKTVDSVIRRLERGKRTRSARR